MLKYRVIQPSRLTQMPQNDRAFNAAALELFRAQTRENPIYRAYCRSLAQPAPRTFEQIPALPVSAFKFHRIATFPQTKTSRVFLTSGTTHGGLRGKHGFKDLRFYDAAVQAHFKECVLPDLKPEKKIALVFLVERADEKPESSLCHMGGRVQKYFGAGKPFYALTRRGSDWDALTRHLEKMTSAGRKILIFATTFALADYLDFLAEKNIRLVLPKGSRIMETGGFKGRRKEIARPLLIKSIDRRLGIPARFVVNEYGMTELSSQFYDLSLKRGRAVSIKSIPTWTRVLIINPLTGRPVPKGRRGLIRVIDLANRDSCLAIQTEDEGRLVKGGFEILGRRKGADLRGCSLTFEEMRAL